MQFSWEKKGLVFVPDGSIPWMASHAQGPSPFVVDNRLRIYFAARPRKDLTLPTFIDVDISDPLKLLAVHERPILELGKPGTFDEHGIIPKQALYVNGQIFLYYIGWQKKFNTPYSLGIGLATSDDGINFKRYRDGPIIGVEKDDAYSLTAPCIFYHNSMYYMYYTAGLNWYELNGRWEHTYTVRMATSKDGINWERDYKNVIEPKDEYECTSCPTVLEIDGLFHMWYSYKGSFDFRGAGKDSYRIGYATSKDLLNWERKDALAGIDVSPLQAWDSEMIEYPAAIQVGEKHLLFYNGNGFSETGFGYAELVKH